MAAFTTYKIMQDLLLKLSWENEKSFTLASKLDNDDAVVIVKVEEDGKIALLWPSVTKLVEDYMRDKMNDIGTAMKA